MYLDATVDDVLETTGPKTRIVGLPEQPSHPDPAGFIAGPAATVDGLVAEADRLDTAGFSSRWPGEQPHP